MIDVATMVKEERQRPGMGTERLPVSALWKTCVTQAASCETELKHNSHWTMPCCERVLTAKYQIIRSRNTFPGRHFGSET